MVLAGVAAWNTAIIYGVYYWIMKDNPFRYLRYDTRAVKSMLQGDFSFGAHSILVRQSPESAPQRKEKPEDYWDGETLDYETGEVGADSRPAVRHPKNRDRAYSGSAERFHDGGGQDS